MIRPVTKLDSRQIAEIYNHYVTNTTITFEEETVHEFEIESRIDKILSLGLPWIVCEEDDQILGYAYASQWHPRSAYRFTVESTVYLDHTQTGKGIGGRIYEELFNILRNQTETRTVMGLLTIPNPGSVRLHEHFGFKQVGEYSQVGFKFNQWIDVSAWQMMLLQV